MYLSDVIADLDPSGMIFPERYQRFCVAKKNCTLTTERNKTALAVPKQSILFIGTWEVTDKQQAEGMQSSNVQHARAR